MTVSDEETLKETQQRLKAIFKQIDQAKGVKDNRPFGQRVAETAMGQGREDTVAIHRSKVNVKLGPDGKINDACVVVEPLTNAQLEAERDKAENDQSTSKAPPGYLNIKKGSAKPGDLGSFVLDDKHIENQKAVTKILDKKASDKKPPETQQPVNSPSQDGRAAASGESIKHWKESLSDLDKREQEQTTLGEY